MNADYTGDYRVCIERAQFRTATSEKGLMWYETIAEVDPSHANRLHDDKNAIIDVQSVLDALVADDAEIHD